MIKKYIYCLFILFIVIGILVFFLMRHIQNKHMSYKINSSILRESDIRGIFGKTIVAEDGYFIGRAISTVLYRKYGKDNKKVIIGFDCRSSSKELFDSLKRGFIESGVDVFSIDLSITPMVSYANIETSADASVMITASHCSENENGFKIATRNNEPFFGESLKSLQDIMNRGDFYKFKDYGNFSNLDIKNDYIERITKDYIGLKPMKVVWDCLSESSVAIVKEVVSRLPGEHIMLFDNINQNFLNKNRDPLKSENLITLRNAVINNKADVGFIFDGDGDRIVVIDKKGEIIDSDKLIVIFGKDILSRNADAVIVVDIKVSDIIFDEIKKYGGNVIISKTGHSFIKDKINSSGAIFGAEVSGHFYWKEKFYGFDDGIYSAIRFLDIMSKTNQSSEFLKNSVPKSFITNEIKIKTNTNEYAKEIVAKIIDLLKSNDIKIIDIDGARVPRKNGWWLARASGTSDAIILRCEGKTEKDKENMLLEMNDYLIKASNEELRLPMLVDGEFVKN